VLGCPWALRELLEVNLRFLSRQDQEGLRRVQVVFDRCERPGGEELAIELRAAFPDLPLTFRFLDPLAGSWVERLDRSKFYASLCWVTGLAECETRYAVLHDFDLYPLRPDLFRTLYAGMRSRGWRFSGSELTHYDGLDDEDGLIGTWQLGIDLEWLRQHHSPLDCFHAVREVGGRAVDLDAFSALQAATPARGLVPDLSPGDFVHVRNLVSTYLKLARGSTTAIAWRLHALWHLRSLTRDGADLLEEVRQAMDQARSSWLEVRGQRVDFSGVHPTCANVLERDVVRLERALWGEVRDSARDYVAAFRSFLERQETPLPEPLPLRHRAAAAALQRLPLKSGSTRLLPHLPRPAHGLAEARLRNGVRVRVDGDDFNGRQLLFFGTPDPKVVATVRACLRPGYAFLDIGANHGSVGFLCHDAVAPGGAIHLFEPQPELCKQIRWALAANSFNVPVDLHAYALLDHDGPARMETRPQHSGAASVAAAGDLEIEARDIARVLPPLLGQRRFGVKLDVEGAEERLLPWLLSQPNCAFVVFERQHADLSLREVRELGYVIYGLARLPLRTRLELVSSGETAASYHDLIALRLARPAPKVLTLQALAERPIS